MTTTVIAHKAHSPWSPTGWPDPSGPTRLALVGIAATIGHYLTDPYNPGFAQYPA